MSFNLKCAYTVFMNPYISIGFCSCVLALMMMSVCLSKSILDRATAGLRCVFGFIARVWYGCCMYVACGRWVSIDCRMTTVAASLTMLLIGSLSSVGSWMVMAAPVSISCCAVLWWCLSTATISVGYCLHKLIRSLLETFWYLILQPYSRNIFSVRLPCLTRMGSYPAACNPMVHIVFGYNILIKSPSLSV